MKILFLALSELMVLFWANNFCRAQLDTVGNIVWYPKIVLTDNECSHSAPKISSQGDTIHITWEGGQCQRFPYLRSTDGGATFEPRREILEDSVFFWRDAPTAFIRQWADDVFIYFQGSPDRGGQSPIFQIRSKDRGDTWEPPRCISADTSSAILSASWFGDTLALLYGGNELGFQYDERILYSTNGGSSWQRRISDHSPRFSWYTRLAVTPNIIHLENEWTSWGPPYILHKRSFDALRSWLDTLILSTDDGNASDLPSIHRSIPHDGTDPLVAVSWRDTKFGTHGWLGASILCRISSDAGATWGEEKQLTDEPNGYSSEVDIDGAIVAGIWCAELSASAGLAEVSVSTDGGITFASPYQLNPDARTTDLPQVSISGNSIHCVWEESFSMDEPYHISYRRGVILPLDTLAGMLKVSYPKGVWNIISNPIGCMGIPQEWMAGVYQFDRGYKQVDTICPGRGYWIRISSDEASDTTITYNAYLRDQPDTLEVSSGWNLIGSSSQSVVVKRIRSIPSGIINSPFYAFSGKGYNVTSALQPGRGYWLKTNRPGRLILLK